MGENTCFLWAASLPKGKRNKLGFMSTVYSFREEGRSGERKVKSALAAGATSTWKD